MKKTKKLLCILLCFTLAVTGITVNTISVNAASKTTLNKSTVTISKGATYNLKIKNAQNVKKVSWKSDEKSVATVSSSGKVSAKNIGFATITCKITYKNNKTEKLSCRVIVKKKETVKESILGTWYFQGIYTDSGTVIMAEIIYKKDGTYIQTYYTMTRLPKGFNPADISFSSNEDGIWAQHKGKYSISSNNIVTLTAPNGEQLKLKYTRKKQTLEFIDMGNNYPMFTRAWPSMYETQIYPPEGYEYVRIYDLVQYKKNEQSVFREKVKGVWYWDLTKWTFNDDGTGEVFFPGNPGSKKEELRKDKTRKFKYTLYFIDKNEYLMDFQWGDDPSSYMISLYFDEDGNVSLGDNSDLLLKRVFDINNCPFTQKKIKDIYSIITGDIFSQWLDD